MVRFFINQWRKKKESWQQLAATCRYSLGLEGIFNPSVYNFFLIILYLFFGKPNLFFFKLLMNNLTKIPVFYASDWADRFRSLSFCQFIHIYIHILGYFSSHLSLVCFINECYFSNWFSFLNNYDIISYMPEQ